MALPIPGYLHLLVSLAQALVLIPTVLLIWAGLARMREPTDGHLTACIAMTTVLFAWWAVIQALGAQNVFWAGNGVETGPLVLATMVIPVAASLFVLARSGRVGDIIDAIPLSWLVGAQFYRVLGVIFLVLWIDGRLPAEFAVSAGWGDIAVGVLAMLVAWMVHRGVRIANSAVLAWSVFGIADLVTAVGLGVMTSPGTLHLLALDNPNLYATAYPLVMVPAFAVPMSLILHGLVFVKLRRLKRDAADRAVSGTRPAGASISA